MLKTDMAFLQDVRSGVVGLIVDHKRIEIILVKYLQNLREIPKLETGRLERVLMKHNL